MGEKILEEKYSAKEKILPLYDAPVKGLQFFVLETIFNEDKIMPWFYCNYIQLEWLDNWCINFSMLQDHYVGYPFVDKQIFIREILNNINFVEFAIRNIDLGWYMHLSLDEYYIPYKSEYKQNHYIHDNMICGYNMEEKFFLIYGYTKKEILEVTKVSFEELENAYQSMDKIAEGNFENSMQYNNIIYIIKKNINVNYEIDLEYMKSLIFEYLNSIPYENKLRMYKNLSDKKIYGISILVKMIKLLKEDKKILLTDFRQITTICEHSMIMAMRVKYLMNQCYIENDDKFYEEFCRISNQALKVKNLQLYYNIGNSKEKVINKIIIILEDIYDSQILIWNKLLKQL